MRKDETNKQTRKVEVTRDSKTGRIIKYTIPSDIADTAIMSVLVSLVDDLNISLNKFNEASRRYTIAILTLTGALVALAIVQIVGLF